MSDYLTECVVPPSNDTIHKITDLRGNYSLHYDIQII